MRFIDGLCEGETIRNVYLCKGKRSERQEMESRMII